MSASTDIQSDRLVLVDVGASGGLHARWSQHMDRITPVLFEPNPTAAAELRRTLRDVPDARVIECGLSSHAGTFTLHVGRYWGCTSLLQPDPDVLHGYQIAPLYDEIGQASVACDRYDTLYAAGEAPRPEVIKLDVEGYEYEVLLGFGQLLETCIGIEVEAWIYPVYRETRLLGEIVAYLRRFGLVLRRFDPIDSFDRDVVVGDAYFTIDRAHLARLDAVQRKKFDLLIDVWSIPAYPA